MEGFELISTALLIVCIVGFVILLCLMVWRFAAYRGATIDDLLDPGRAFGFFTFVAGTNVLGVRLGMEGAHAATAVLLGLAGTAWLLLGYVVPWTAVLDNVERPVVATANGTWFIWVVASQSVAIAASSIEPVFVTGRRELAVLAVLAVMSRSVGVFLYAATAMIVSLRGSPGRCDVPILRPPASGSWSLRTHPHCVIAVRTAFAMDLSMRRVTVSSTAETAVAEGIQSPIASESSTRELRGCYKGLWTLSLW